MSLHLVFARCPEAATITIVTTLLDSYSVTYCPESEHSEMKALTKTILFATVTHERKVYTWPIAAFPTGDAAKTYASFLRLLYRAGDEPSILACDPARLADADGAAVKNVKWSLKTVPYSPEAFIEDDVAAVTEDTKPDGAVTPTA